MATNASAVLAFDVGGTTIKAEILDADLTVLASAAVPTPYGAGLVDAVAAIGQALLETLPTAVRGRVSDVGLVIPGVVDAARGVSVYAANLGLRQAPIAGPVSERLGLPVTISHDVGAAAEAERRRGAARYLEDPVIVVIGTGIAAVSYVRGAPVVGVSGQAGEFGHMVVRPAGPLCGCGGYGCLEAVASAGAVVRAYRDASGTAVSGAREVVARLGHDPIADRVWAEVTDALADGLLAVVALLAPGAVVLGGGLADAGAVLVEPVAARMKRSAPALHVPPLVVAELGPRAGVLGAALLALDAAGAR